MQSHWVPTPYWIPQCHLCPDGPGFLLGLSILWWLRPTSPWRIIHIRTTMSRLIIDYCHLLVPWFEGPKSGLQNNTAFRISVEWFMIAFYSLLHLPIFDGDRLFLWYQWCFWVVSHDVCAVIICLPWPFYGMHCCSFIAGFCVHRIWIWEKLTIVDLLLVFYTCYSFIFIFILFIRWYVSMILRIFTTFIWQLSSSTFVKYIFASSQWLKSGSSGSFHMDECFDYIILQYIITLELHFAIYRGLNCLLQTELVTSVPRWSIYFFSFYRSDVGSKYPTHRFVGIKSWAFDAQMTISVHPERRPIAHLSWASKFVFRSHRYSTTRNIHLVRPDSVLSRELSIEENQE